jgi:exonuclease III
MNSAGHNQNQNDLSENIPSTKSIWLTNLNCRSLLSHIDELRLIFQRNNPFLISVTETWLSQSVYDEEISIAGFSLLRKDREGRRGGGCAVYVANGFKFKRREDLEESAFEVLWIEAKIRSSVYVIGCAYRPPDFPANEFFDYLDDVVRSQIRAGKEVIVTGDLNCNLIDKSLVQTQRAMEFMEANDLSLLISSPTRHSLTCSTLLDLIITSTPAIFSRVGVLQNSLSDHFPVYGVIHGLSCRPRHRIIISRSWNEDHITAFQADMAKIPWNNLTTPDNIDQKLENWNTFFRNNLDKHFPVRRKRIRQK